MWHLLSLACYIYRYVCVYISMYAVLSRAFSLSTCWSWNVLKRENAEHRIFNNNSWKSSCGNFSLSVCKINTIYRCSVYAYVETIIHVYLAWIYMLTACVCRWGYGAEEQGVIFIQRRVRLLWFIRNGRIGTEWVESPWQCSWLLLKFLV